MLGAPAPMSETLTTTRPLPHAASPSVSRARPPRSGAGDLPPEHPNGLVHRPQCELSLRIFVGRQGLEPWTYGLKARSEPSPASSPNPLIFDRKRGRSAGFCDKGEETWKGRDATLRDAKTH